ncbi:MAG TPA: hypothetical protein VJV78_21595, partial [Polyangiales bacterium]|nr:hypothetical protein [Polyangiales bacterium]
MAGGLQESNARIRAGLRVAAVGCALLLASCIGGPHPLPPGGNPVSTSPSSTLPVSPGNNTTPTTPTTGMASSAAGAAAAT